MEGRALEIYGRYSEYIKELVPLEDEEGYFKAILYFHDGTNLRLSESWEGERLIEYSYYWLTEANRLKVGWDNAPHHKKLESFPHHKHVGQQAEIQSSAEITLDAVMRVIVAQMSSEEK